MVSFTELNCHKSALDLKISIVVDGLMLCYAITAHIGASAIKARLIDGAVLHSKT